MVAVTAESLSIFIRHKKGDQRLDVGGLDDNQVQPIDD